MVKKKDLHRAIISYGNEKVGTITIAKVKAYYDSLSELYYVVPIEAVRKFIGVQYACIYGKDKVDYFAYKTFSGAKNKIINLIK